MNTELIEQNAHRLLGAMTGAATTAMVAVGDQLGLYRALADGGPATQDELAARTGTAARYLREWLSQQAAAGFLAYREGDGRYALTAEAAAVLADEASPAFLAGGATITRGWFAGIDRLAGAFPSGGRRSRAWRSVPGLSPAACRQAPRAAPGGAALGASRTPGARTLRGRTGTRARPGFRQRGNARAGRMRRASPPATPAPWKDAGRKSVGYLGTP